MKKIKIIAIVICFTATTNAQRRTIVVPAPQPPGVPIDGGLLALLIGGGAMARKYYQPLKSTN